MRQDLRQRCYKKIYQPVEVW